MVAHNFYYVALTALELEMQTALPPNCWVLILFLINCVYLSLFVCGYVHGNIGVHGDENRVSGPLEPEFQNIVDISSRCWELNWAPLQEQ